MPPVALRKLNRIAFMRWTVVVPGALLPSPIAADVLAGAPAPWLQSVLARALAGHAITFDGHGAPHLGWLWQQFGGTGEPVTAPYALRAFGLQADVDAQCWHVDPVHFAVTLDHLLVTSLDEAPLRPEEEAVLAEHLRAALRQCPAAPRLHLHRGQWLLTLSAPWSLRATPLDGAIGRPAHEHWPEGADATAWRRLLTEVQMRWHQEPLNEFREARGERTVNALWLHGGGVWSALPKQPFAAVVGDDAVLRGWALASAVSPEALLDDGAVPPPRGNVVSLRRDLLLPAQFEAWSEWLSRLAQLEAALRALCEVCFSSGYEEIDLVLGGRRQARVVHLRRRDAWRFWRRAPLPSALAEATEP
jgi:hypothetical protein